MKLTLSNSDDSGRALDPLSNSASNRLARSALIFATGALLYWALASLVPYFSGLDIIRLSPFFVGAAGYFLGFRAGVCASLAAVVIHTLVFNRLGFDGPLAILHVSPAAHIGIILIGPLAGRLRTNNRRLRSEIVRGKESEGELREAQLRFRQLADTIEDVLWTCSADRTQMVYLSPAFEAIFGISRTRIENNPRSLVKFVHPDDRRSVMQMFDSSPEIVSQIEYRIIRPDGEMRRIQSRSLCVRDKDSAVQRIAGVWTDVTDSRNEGLALQVSEAKYRDLVENIPAVVYVAPLDLSQPFLYVSPQIEFVLGYPQDVWMSNPDKFIRSYHPDDADAVMGQLRKCISEKRRFVADYRMIMRNGSVRWFHDEADIVRDQSGEPMFVQGVLRDVTQNRHNEAMQRGRSRVLVKLAAGASMPDVLTTLAESVEELVPDSICMTALLDRETNRMHCGAFHSQPAGFFKMFDGFQPGPDADCIGRVIHAGDRAIIADVSACSLDADHVQRMAESGLRGCWAEPIQSSRGETLGALAIYLRKPAEPDQRDLDVLVSAGALAGIIIEQRQTESALRKSEERYSRLSEVIERKRVEEQFVPARQSETVEPHLPADENAVPREEPQGPSPGPETALVAGDEPGVQRLIRGVLQKKGFRVLLADDGETALQVAAEKGKIDLLITDVVMPRGNGRDLAEELRSRHPRLKVLFITGYTGSASVRIAELGPETSFLSKPFSSEAFARKIRVLMDTALPGWPATKTGRTALDNRPL